MKPRENITINPKRGGTGLELRRRKPEAPSSSWWAEKDFKAAYDREKPRLRMHTQSLRSSEFEK